MTCVDGPVCDSVCYCLNFKVKGHYPNISLHEVLVNCFIGLSFINYVMCFFVVDVVIFHARIYYCIFPDFLAMETPKCCM